MLRKDLAKQTADEKCDNENYKTKRRFTEPKLTFVEPKLTKHGDATKITGQFFGSFTP